MPEKFGDIIPGDKDHPFLELLKKVIEKQKEKRAQIMRVRQNTWRKFGDKPADIPRDCYTGETWQHAMISVKDIKTKFITGKEAPNRVEVVQLALNHGLDGEAREAFIRAGEAYIEDCQAKHDARSAGDVKENAQPAKDAKEDATQSPLALPTLKEVLQDIMSCRWYQTAGNKILLEMPKDGRKQKLSAARVIPLYPTIIRERILNGEDPHAKVSSIEECHSELRLILEDIMATSEERDKAFAAFERDARREPQPKQPKPKKSHVDAIAEQARNTPATPRQPEQRARGG